MRRYRYAICALVAALIGAAVLHKYVLKEVLEPALAAQDIIQPRPASWAQSVDASYQLYQMDELLYRSALPRAQDQPWLQEQNVQTVINFYQKPDSLWLQDKSIEQIHIPLRTDRIDDEDVILALRSIASARQHGKVLMHCKHGQNRTGLIAAMYRIVYEGWSKADAMLEMQQGYGGESRMDDATRYLQKVDVVAIEQALARGACSTQALAWCQVAQWFKKQTRHILSNDTQHSPAWVEQQQRAWSPAEI